MEKKFKFSDQPTRAKILYGAVIAILCISAIVVGIVAANNRRDKTPEEPPKENVTPDDTPEAPNEQPPEKKPIVYVSPVVGTVCCEHSLTVPVLSTTLGEWRVHTGIDIATEEGAVVYAAAPGTVTNVYTDPMLGVSVEITHEDGVKTVYSNLSEAIAEGIVKGAVVESGRKLGHVGDTSVSELAEEPHLHFAVKVKDVSVNPLDYISEESQKVSLGINKDTET